MTTFKVTKQWKRKVRRVFRNMASRNAAPIHSTINGRARYVPLLAKAGEAGRIAFVHESMDCDCFKSRTVSHVPTPTVVAAWQMIERAYEGAEGPTSAYFAKPSAEPEGYASADLALEAFEDGHPYSVINRSL